MKTNMTTTLPRSQVSVSEFLLPLILGLNNGGACSRAEVHEDGRDRPQSSGVYFYRIETGAETKVGKMVLAR